ncbi:MAG: 4-hydroxy-tetrahydrodipicolinate synthase [Spirochaetota bacterium]
MFQGVFTAIITPFQNDRIDYDSYFKILDGQIRSNISGVVPCGTTGESPALSHAEHKELIQKTVEYIQGRKLVIAGTGSNSTREALALTESACQDGVDGVLLVNPYYNKPTQDGLFYHFKEIATHSTKPVMLYNIPSRTSVNLLPKTILRLLEYPNIQAIKEATGDLAQMAEVISICKDRIAVLSGDDALTLPLLSLGGTGVVSVISNVFPNSIAKMVSSFTTAPEDARSLYFAFFRLFQLAFCETNPIPIKAVMHWLGACSEELRLPMTKITESTAAEKLKEEVFRLKENGYE